MCKHDATAYAPFVKDESSNEHFLWLLFHRNELKMPNKSDDNNGDDKIKIHALAHTHAHTHHIGNETFLTTFRTQCINT